MRQLREERLHERGLHARRYLRCPAIRHGNRAIVVPTTSKYSGSVASDRLRFAPRHALEATRLKSNVIKNESDQESYRHFDDENLNRAAEAVRQSQNIKRARAAVSPQIIDSYFEELSETLKDVPPEAIINYDETSMKINPGKSKVNVHRSCKYPERIIDFSKSNFSVMFASTARGIALLRYLVYKADNLYSKWTEGGPAGTRYNRSKSG
ncbi:hypothetical protein ANN_26773 [Periplaneta americana]|uniref:PiggyBac transposable element-derived protein domain-containing protein n=1 Tax=Periplaneta americana TaxID=6978 RepID=A0ABQ8RZ06_PERAM|nr:hypothetical protein ANN_26773 [Periplaneta americana]